jgi:TPR repeat protein
VKIDRTILGWVVGAAAVLAMGSPLAQVRDAADAARAWEQFLKTADVDEAYGALDILDKVGYDVTSVDAAKCRDNADAMRAAVAAAPVSLAIRRAALLCADALNDSATAEREMAVVAALSQQAMKQAGTESLLSDPIRVLGLADAYALVESLGMTARYSYYSQVHASRHFPFVIAAWDEDAKRERRLRFDFVDTAYTLSRSNPLAGYPMLRTVMANAFISGGVKADLLSSVDAAAVQAAAAEARPEDKVAKLRRSANAGGVQAATSWLMVCAFAPKYTGCADGLVDALLPGAEANNAVAMVLLAFAQHEGIGTKRDAAAAWALLDAADRVAPQEAVNDFVSLWSMTRSGTPLPAEAGQRLSRAGKTVKAARLTAIQLKAAGKAELDAADLAFLADPAVNRRGQGYSVLVDYFEARGRKKEQQDATQKAALAGSTAAKARYALTLFTGADGVTRDVARADALFTEAAHEGNVRAALYKAGTSYLAGNFAAAESWALAPASAADVDAILFLADLYTQGRPGVSGDIQRALRIYNMIAADEAGGAPARRALAELALRGKGMPKDPAKAKQWLQGDASAGDHESEAMLGSHYLKGDFGKVEESEGRRWLERAVAANNERAFVEYGNWLFQTKGDAKSRAQAIELWTRGEAAGYVSSTNSHAWVLCTSIHDDVFDPKRGQEMSKRLGDTERMAPGVLDTVAACEAAAGDFKRAAALQERAAAQLAIVDAAPGPESDGKQPGYRQRLDLYRAGKVYRSAGTGN